MKKFILLYFTAVNLAFTFSKKVENKPTEASGSSSSTSTSSSVGKYLPLSSSCYRNVYNRGKIKPEVLNNIVDFVRSAPDQVFEKNEESDVYSMYAKKFGPIANLKQRRAIMADIQIVLGGFESSWRYGEGIDQTTSSSKSCDQWEAGMFQVSSNSMYFGKGKLTKLYEVACEQYKSLGTCKGFQKCTKEEPAFAHSYVAVLMRYTINHHGPLKRGEVTKYLSKSCQNEIEGIL